MKLTARLVILVLSGPTSRSAYSRVAALSFMELNCKQKGMLEENGNAYIRTVAIT